MATSKTSSKVSWFKITIAKCSQNAKSIINLLKSYIDHPSVHTYKDEEDQDILDALSDDELEHAGIAASKEFNILEYLSKSRKFNKALSLICTTSTVDEEALYCLSLEKLHKFLDQKYNELLTLIKSDEGCQTKASEKGLIQKWVEILFSEMQVLVLLNILLLFTAQVGKSLLPFPDVSWSN